MGRWQQLSPFCIRLDFVMGTRDFFDDDNKFHEITFEEFEDLISANSEVEIPLDSFKDFVDEVSDYEEDMINELNSNLVEAELLLRKGKISEAFEMVNRIQNVLPQALQKRLWGIYEQCAERGNVDANILLADHYFEHWENADGIRGKAVKYLKRLYDAGFLPYYSRLGLCYLKGLGVSADKEEAKRILMEGMLFHGDFESYALLEPLIPPIEGAFKEGVRLFLGKGVEKNPVKAFELLTNAALHEDADRGYCLSRLADIMVENNIPGGNARKAFLLYKNAVTTWIFDVPEDESFFEEDVYYKIGRCYYDGFGVQKDYFKAAWYFDMARGTSRNEDKIKVFEDMIRNSYAKAESLVEDDVYGEYYTECFKIGEIPEFDYFFEDDDDAFLYL